LNKNVIFHLFCFPQVLQEQTLGEVGTWTATDAQLCQEYSYQKFLKSDTPSSSYNR